MFSPWITVTWLSSIEKGTVCAKPFAVIVKSATHASAAAAPGAQTGAKVRK